ncbi:MAG: transcriptional repressor [Alphaproteobacteria bacterium]|nr:transcriptional repressor [Alphaproteobacteria bacterium]
MEARTYSPSAIDVLARIRAVKLRPTRQRIALAQLLFEPGDHHVTAESLFDQAQSAGVKVSLATVYNTLHQFTAAGLLREVVVNSACTYFDTNISDHHHFFYESRNALIDIDGAKIDIRGVPAIPEGARISRVDVIIRLSRQG